MAASVATITFVLLLMVCGLIILICFKSFQSKSTKDCKSFDPHPPADAPVIPVYESVYPMEFQEESLKLNDNIAYGPLPAVRAS